ncbi:hypothetical protein BJV78DRAFT_1185990, partial [Lactifluus subvellereus]
MACQTSRRGTRHELSSPQLSTRATITGIEMPTLAPSCLPPNPPIASPSPFFASSKVTRPSAQSQMSIAPTSPERGSVAQRLDVPLKRERELKIPFMKLETPAIQEDMAASLAVTLLGHILFLKSQVPFPVAQLGRVPGASSASRAARKRADMITAFDELSSHLHTTFSALSTALARNPTHGSTDTVYLALVLGPTIGAPKARVILALEGLEVKVWGRREVVEEARLSSDGPREDDDADDCSSVDGSEAGGDSHEEAEEDTGSDTEESPSSPPPSEPPSSRSPSPSSPEGPSLPSSPAPATSNGASRRPLRPSLSPKSSSPSSSASQPYLATKPTRTHAEEQQTLRAAERLLARTLVNAYAGGGGMAAELAPTQTHVLLRAPRRFSHPAWLPRQNVSASLDNTLWDFLVDSGLGDAETSTAAGNAKPRRRGAGGGGVKTEGVLVSCCQTEADESNAASALPPVTGEASEEDDELIWWAWDGKLTGFAE